MSICAHFSNTRHTGGARKGNKRHWGELPYENTRSYSFTAHSLCLFMGGLWVCAVIWLILSICMSCSTEPNIDRVSSNFKFQILIFSLNRPSVVAPESYGSAPRWDDVYVPAHDELYAYAKLPCHGLQCAVQFPPLRRSLRIAVWGVKSYQSEELCRRKGCTTRSSIWCTVLCTPSTTYSRNRGQALPSWRTLPKSCEYTYRA